MEPIAALFSAVLAVSITLNFVQTVRLRRMIKRPPKPTMSAEDLMHDLTTRGNAVVRLTVIDPQSLFLRSPKH